jgi:hypothetical protein
MSYAPWATNNSRPMIWTKFSYGEPLTWPPFREVVLWCDDIACMFVGYIDEGCHDVIIWLGEKHEEDMNEGREPFCVEEPKAWMPLPRPPMTILEGEETAEVTARSADIMNDLEPVLRRIIAEHLTKEQAR